MIYHISMIGRLKYLRRLLLPAAILLVLLSSLQADAHPMPSSALLLDLRSHDVTARLQLPLAELQLAFGHEIAIHSEDLSPQEARDLTAYLLAHIRPISGDGRPWTVIIDSMRMGAAEQTFTGPYRELTVYSRWLPAAGAAANDFVLRYDAIIHQVVTHKVLVSLRNDAQTEAAGLGLIALNVRDNTIPPLTIHKDPVSAWNSFAGMIRLGIQHIAEGTDHLLFLLALLLPAPLLTGRHRWKGPGGIRYSIIRLLKIVTAFTIGHSLTLAVGAFGWFSLPAQLVETTIAFSILVSAANALYPIFPGRETYIAAGFGLIHGLAFAAVLARLHLEPARMLLSLLGFNIGIELMQLAVVACTIPWLIILSRRIAAYNPVRIIGAILTAIAAIAWMTERISGNSNKVTQCIQAISPYAPWLIAPLALLAMTTYVLAKKKPFTLSGQ